MNFLRQRDGRDIQIETMTKIAGARERNFTRCREQRDVLARALRLVIRRSKHPETIENGEAVVEIATDALKEAGYET